LKNKKFLTKLFRGLTSSHKEAPQFPQSAKSSAK